MSRLHKHIRRNRAQGRTVKVTDMQSTAYMIKDPTQVRFITVSVNLPNTKDRHPVTLEMLDYE